MNQPQVTVFSAVDLTYQPIADVTWPLMKAWCQKKNYGCYTSQLPAGDRHPSWRKLPFLFQHCFDDHVNVWCDADVFIRDPELDLTPYIPVDGISFSADYNGLCAGFFITHGNWARAFLEMVWRLGPVPGSDKHEQDTIKLLYSMFHSVAERIGFIHQTAVSNPVNFTPRKQCAAFHAWAADWNGKDLGNRALAVLQSLT